MYLTSRSWHYIALRRMESRCEGAGIVQLWRAVQLQDTVQLHGVVQLQGFMGGKLFFCL